MILDKFKLGWINIFEKRIQNILDLFPSTKIETLIRYHGMLRIKFRNEDERVQEIIDAVSFKIERDSARTCESCGKMSGRRREEFLPEKMCLCWQCYALEVDASGENNNPN
jgi:RNA polymerase-binding transcription factor DksA